jgi:hypothetical protein
MQDHLGDRQALQAALVVIPTECPLCWSLVDRGHVVLKRWPSNFNRVGFTAFHVAPWPLKPDVLMTLKEIFPTLEEWRPSGVREGGFVVRGADAVFLALLPTNDDIGMTDPTRLRRGYA